LVRGGISIFSRAVERIITTFGRVEDRLRELLEEFRRQIVRGIPELSIPILDPLHIDRIDFDIIHEAAALKGNVEDVTVKHISKFVIDKERFTDLGNLRFKLDLNLTFPYLVINGFYKVNGIIGDSISIFGDAISAIIKFESLRLKLTSLDIDIKLRKLQNNFDNLMGNKEIGDLFNKAISKMAPEAIDMLWPDIKEPVEEEVSKYINNILENATVASLARRLFNISACIIVEGTINVCIPLSSTEVKGTYDTNVALQELKTDITSIFKNDSLCFDHMDLDLKHPAIRIEFENFSVAMTNFSWNISNHEFCFPINIDLDFYIIKNYFDNLMGDELEALINRVISAIGPEALEIIWSEMKDIFDKPLEDMHETQMHCWKK
ncbi:uncharacterized protein BDFB_008715, partial [Asbolus verrucosus]